ARFLAQPAAAAIRAQRVATILREKNAHVQLVLLRLHPIEEAAHARPVAATFDDRLLIRPRELVERHCHRDLFRATELFQLLHGPLVLWLGPWLNRTVFQG